MIKGKDFTLAKKPGAATAAAEKPVSPDKPVMLGSGPTTRKTIEVPEDYFYLVKERAVKRRMKEKDLWAEILQEYFSNNP
jgi:hypothetical protein